MMLGRGLFFKLFIIVVVVVAFILPSPEARPTPHSPPVSLHSPVHNVLDYGAVGDDHHDDTQAFVKAWKATCNSASSSSTMIVPGGKHTFFINTLSFEGPCKSHHVNVQINGHIVAPKNPTDWTCHGKCNAWIEFRHVNGLSIYGNGTIDGRGQKWWNIHTKAKPAALMIADSNNVSLSGLTLRNNPRMHVILHGLETVNVTNLHIYSPEKSPNTDGIHVGQSKNVLIAHSDIQTGDDCISIVDGTYHVKVHDIKCGPGHGISIGSLGRHGAEERVAFVHVSNVTFNRSTNGARIKTWQGGRGYAKHITFERITLIEADNPIIIDQFYCDHEKCTDHKDAVQVSDITFRHFVGTTSKKKTGVVLECSKTVPCEVLMEDIHIVSSDGERVTSLCESAHAKIEGTHNAPQIHC